MAQKQQAERGENLRREKFFLRPEIFFLSPEDFFLSPEIFLNCLRTRKLFCFKRYYRKHP